MRVNQVRTNVGHNSPASFENCGKAPRKARRQIKFRFYDSDAPGSITRCKPSAVRRQSHHNVHAERSEGDHLFEGPLGAEGGFDNVEDLHGHSQGEAYLTAPVWTIQGGGGK